MVPESMNEKESSELAKDLEAVAGLLTRLKEGYPKGTTERRLLLLAKHATFFICLKHVSTFGEFLLQMESGLSTDQLKRLEDFGINSE